MDLRPQMWLLGVAVPLGYLLAGFVLYVVCLFVYQAWSRGKSLVPAAVVILGAGLVNGGVTALLAARLTRGLEVFLAASPTPALVVSGGKGSDQSRPEAEAMGEYLVGLGIDPAMIIHEDQSTTTRENFTYTVALLAERGVAGPVLAVTSNFHTFRAYLLMREAKVSGLVLGAPIAGHPWFSAVLREYGALLLDHLRLVILGQCVAFLPLLIMAGITIFA